MRKMRYILHCTCYLFKEERVTFVTVHMEKGQVVGKMSTNVHNMQVDVKKNEIFSMQFLNDPYDTCHYILPMNLSSTLYVFLGWTGWEQHVLIENGPDVHVTMHTIEDQGQNYSVIVTGKSIGIHSIHSSRRVVSTCSGQQ